MRKNSFRESSNIPDSHEVASCDSKNSECPTWRNWGLLSLFTIQLKLQIMYYNFNKQFCQAFFLDLQLIPDIIYQERYCDFIWRFCHIPFSSLCFYIKLNRHVGLVYSWYVKINCLINNADVEKIQMYWCINKSSFLTTL